jgi:Tetracyclin repressor-like, C-terminal domain
VFGNEDARRVVDLLRYATIARRHIGPHAPLARGYKAISRKWLALIGQALPDLSADALVWGFSFAVGSLYSWQLFDHLYDEVLPHGRELSPDEITDMLTAFCCAGLRGLEASELEGSRKRTSVHIPRLSSQPPRN